MDWIGLWQLFVDALPGWIARLAGAGVVLWLGWWLSNKVASLAERTLVRRDFDITIARFVQKALFGAGIAVVVLAAAGIVGIETASLAAVLAAGAFAVGMALQGSLGNLAAGLLLVAMRPYRVGDLITVAGHTGKVVEVGLLTTTLDTLDNRRITVPNGAVLGGTIENLTALPVRRVDVVVGCDYGADLEATRRALEAAIEKVETRLPDQAHQVVLTGLGASSVDWQVRVWCRAADYFACHEETTAAVKKSLDAAGISIPYPQLDVHLDAPPTT